MNIFFFWSIFSFDCFILWTYYSSMKKSMYLKTGVRSSMLNSAWSQCWATIRDFIQKLMIFLFYWNFLLISTKSNHFQIENVFQIQITKKSPKTANLSTDFVDFDSCWNAIVKASTIRNCKRCCKHFNKKKKTFTFFNWNPF